MSAAQWHQSALTKLNPGHEQPSPSASISSSKGSQSWLERHSLLLASLCIIFAVVPSSTMKAEDSVQLAKNQEHLS